MTGIDDIPPIDRKSFNCVSVEYRGTSVVASPKNVEPPRSRSTTTTIASGPLATEGPGEGSSTVALIHGIRYAFSTKIHEFMVGGKGRIEFSVGRDERGRY